MFRLTKCPWGVGYKQRSDESRPLNWISPTPSILHLLIVPVIERFDFANLFSRSDTLLWNIGRDSKICNHSRKWTYIARLDNYSSAKKAAICLWLIHRQIQSSVWKMRFVVFWITSFQLWPKFFSKVTNLVLLSPTSAGYARGASYSYFALLSMWEQIYTIYILT